MKIYIEYIFIINYLLDYMILYGTKRILKLNRKNVYLFLGSFVGCLTTFLLYIRLTTIMLLIIKIVLSIIIVIVSLGKNDFKRKIGYFYLISIILGGLVYLLDLNKSNNYFLLLICLSFFTIYILIKEFLSYKEKIVNKYLVKIYYNDSCYELNGFIDTGNNLKSPIKKEPVILVNLNIDFNKVIYVPYKALNTTGVIPCIKPDKVIINNLEFKKCLVGLARDKLEIDGMECIIPNIFKERLC